MHQASNTFEMDEALGCARVKVQYGDDDQKIEVKLRSYHGLSFAIKVLAITA